MGGGGDVRVIARARGARGDGRPRGWLAAALVLALAAGFLVGMTTGKAFVLGTEDLYREWGYVAMSRGSVENHLFVVAPRERDRDEYAPAQKQRDPLDALIGSLEYSEAQTAALDVTAHDGIRRMTTAELLTERGRIEERLHRSHERRGELERVVAQWAEAERAADDAASRIAAPRQGGGEELGASDRAIETHARQRAHELAARRAELERHVAGRSSIDLVEDRARYTAIRDELDRRARGDVRAAVAARPEYLVNELGPYPNRRSKRRAWYRAAVRIETYRQEYGIDDARSAFGAEPRGLAQRSALREVRREVQPTRQELQRSVQGRIQARGLR